MHWLFLSEWRGRRERYLRLFLVHRVLVMLLLSHFLVSCCCGSCSRCRMMLSVRWVVCSVCRLSGVGVASRLIILRMVASLRLWLLGVLSRILHGFSCLDGWNELTMAHLHLWIHGVFDGMRIWNWTHANWMSRFHSSCRQWW